MRKQTVRKTLYEIVTDKLGDPTICTAGELISLIKALDEDGQVNDTFRINLSSDVFYQFPGQLSESHLATEIATDAPEYYGYEHADSFEAAERICPWYARYVDNGISWMFFESVSDYETHLGQV